MSLTGVSKLPSSSRTEDRLSDMSGLSYILLLFKHTNHALRCESCKLLQLYIPVAIRNKVTKGARNLHTTSNATAYKSLNGLGMP
jgi:hypothetical protein